MDKKVYPECNRRGFTLVELLVVVSIIAILSVIGLVIFTNVQKNARDAKRKGDLQAIHTALEIYKTQNGTYPQTSGWRFSDSASPPWLDGLDSNYMVSMPLDPKNSGGPSYSGGYTYGYFTSTGYGGTNGSYYMLIAHLEIPNDSDKKTTCTLPDGTRFGSNNSGALEHIYIDNFFVCNQQ